MAQKQYVSPWGRGDIITMLSLDYTLTKCGVTMDATINI